MRWTFAVLALLLLQWAESRPPQIDSLEFPGEVATSRPRPPPSTRRPSTTTTTATTSASACNCPSTPEFNPVCGTNNVTYDNPGKLNCARFCGTSVDLRHYGNCPTQTPT